MTRIPTLADLGDVNGKRVLVRTDFNVPMEGGVITDDFRIRSALPTIEWLKSRGAHVVCASHLGRPKGKPDPKYSMDAVRARLAELAPGVELLENLRYDPGETVSLIVTYRKDAPVRIEGSRWQRDITPEKWAEWLAEDRKWIAPKEMKVMDSLYKKALEGDVQAIKL